MIIFRFYSSAFTMIDVSNEKVTISMLAKVAPELADLARDFSLENRLHIEATYEAAAEDQAEEVREVRQNESLIIPRNMDYASESLSLSFEEREKLLTVQPQTVSIVILVFNKFNLIPNSNFYN